MHLMETKYRPQALSKLSTLGSLYIDMTGFGFQLLLHFVCNSLCPQKLVLFQENVHGMMYDMEWQTKCGFWKNMIPLKTIGNR